MRFRSPALIVLGILALFPASEIALQLVNYSRQSDAFTASPSKALVQRGHSRHLSDAGSRSDDAADARLRSA